MSRLYKTSAAYRYYVDNEGRVKGMPELEDGGNLEYGERSCRVQVGDELCGNWYKDRGALSNHIGLHHKHIKIPASSATGNPSEDKVQEAKVFYSAMIKVHNELTASEPVTKTSTIISDNGEDNNQRPRAKKDKSNQPAAPKKTPATAKKTPAAAKKTSAATKKKASGKSTRSSQRGRNTLPKGRDDLWTIPVFTSGDSKGRVNYPAMIAKVLEAGGSNPCVQCGKKDVINCLWEEDCRNSLFFKGWDEFDKVTDEEDGNE